MKHNWKKLIIAIVLILPFVLTGCVGGGEAGESFYGAKLLFQDKSQINSTEFVVDGKNMLEVFSYEILINILADYGTGVDNGGYTYTYKTNKTETLFAEGKVANYLNTINAEGKVWRWNINSANEGNAYITEFLDEYKIDFQMAMLFIMIGENIGVAGDALTFFEAQTLKSSTEKIAIINALLGEEGSSAITMNNNKLVVDHLGFFDDELSVLYNFILNTVIGNDIVLLDNAVKNYEDNIQNMINIVLDKLENATDGDLTGVYQIIPAVWVKDYAFSDLEETPVNKYPLNIGEQHIQAFVFMPKFQIDDLYFIFNIMATENCNMNIYAKYYSKTANTYQYNQLITTIILNKNTTKEFEFDSSILNLSNGINAFTGSTSASLSTQASVANQHIIDSINAKKESGQVVFDYYDTQTDFLELYFEVSNKCNFKISIQSMLF